MKNNLFAFIVIASMVSSISAKNSPHKVEVTFTVEVTPPTPEDWQKIADSFDTFITTAKNTPNNRESIPDLLESLGSALMQVPEICSACKMNGHVHCNINFVEA